MTIERTLQFLESAWADATMQEEIRSAVAGKDGLAAAGAVSGIGQERGFDFTAEEIFEVRALLKQEMIKNGRLEGELTEEELEAVAGGLNNKYPENMVIKVDHLPHDEVMKPLW